MRGVFVKEAVLYEKANGKIQCFSCLRECAIPNDKVGFCRTRKNVGGKLVSLYYGYFSGIRAQPLKTKPFLHFKDPVTGKMFSGEEQTLSIGGFSCNYECKGCQNVCVSKTPANVEDVAIRRTPRQIIDETLEKGIKIIAFTWNEPAIMPEIVFDVAKLAKENGIRTVYVSNGSPTRKHLDLILPYIDAFRYDIKAGPEGGDKFYNYYCNFNINGEVRKILDSIKYTKDAGKHIEILTVLVPRHEPCSAKSILNTAHWIKDNLGDDTPWHLAKFFPAHEFNEPDFLTSDAMIDACAMLARSVGLTRVYGVKDMGCDCLKPETTVKKTCSCCH